MLHIYLAENLVAGDPAREEGEHGMEVYEFTLDEVNKMITEGRIVDGKSISGIHMFQNKNK